MSPNEPAFAKWQAEARKRGYSDLVSVPLVYARDKCLGALNFYSDNPDYFTPDRIKLCQIFANQAAIAIENARLIEDLEGKVVERTKKLEDTNRELQSANMELVLRREEADAASNFEDRLSGQHVTRTENAPQRNHGLLRDHACRYGRPAD